MDKFVTMTDTDDSHLLSLVNMSGADMKETWHAYKLWKQFEFISSPTLAAQGSVESKYFLPNYRQFHRDS